MCAGDEVRRVERMGHDGAPQGSCADETRSTEGFCFRSHDADAIIRSSLEGRMLWHDAFLNPIGGLSDEYLGPSQGPAARADFNSVGDSKIRDGICALRIQLSLFP